MNRPDHLKWVIPDHMEAVRQKINLPVQRVIVPQPGQPILMGDGKIKITPFAGLHWQYPSGHWEQGEPSAGVDATGYLFEWDDKRLLLPGDTRTYDVSALTRFGPVDTLLGHVWLGRDGALEDPPPCLEAFCRFMAVLEPARRILLTHLWEQSRDPDNYWDERHAEKVRQRLIQLLPAGIDIQIPDFWKAISL